MIDFALDPTETRDTRSPVVRGRSRNLRVLVFGLAGFGALAGFGVAATTLMSGLAAPAPVKLVTHGRAADWPELKDGLPAVAGAGPSTPAALTASEPVAPVPRMAALPDPVPPSPAPARTASAPARAAAAAEPPTRRIPTPTPAVALAPARQAVPLPPARVAALQVPRASETVRARDASPQPTRAAATSQLDKPAHKAPVAVAKAPAPVKSANKAKPGVAATVAQAEPAESEETEVLGIKLPSLAPAGRKIKESVDALGEAVRKVF